jgi:hypothetical protein
MMPHPERAFFGWQLWSARANGVIEIYVDGPREYRALWRKDYTQLIFLIVIVASLVLERRVAKKTVKEEKRKPIIKTIKNIGEEKETLQGEKPNIVQKMSGR